MNYIKENQKKMILLGRKKQENFYNHIQDMGNKKNLVIIKTT